MKCKLYLNKCFTLLAALLLASTLSQAQSVTVTGTVTDVAGQPLIGVAVTVQGTSTGVTTDAKGKYSIKVPNAEAVLNFNYLGYVDQTQTIGARRVIDVTMEEDAQTLDEVVVIGYGTVKRRDVTGSVASVGGEDIQAMPVANAAQALQGRIAGVTISTQDGRPDAGVQIRVRGGGSITQSNEPLYIVDGFPVDNISDIPSTQIESIDILKDASSTAIYGARGANGVVIVTTKSPKSDRLSVTYDMYVQLKTPTEFLDYMSPYDYVLYNWEYAMLNGGTYPIGFEEAFAVGADPANQAVNPKGIEAYRNMPAKNWQKDLVKNSFAHSHNINISGGNDKTKYSITYNYINDDALKTQSWYKRTNVLAKLSQVLAKGLRLEVDARYADVTVFGSESVSNDGGSRLTKAGKFTPVTPLGNVANSNFAMVDEFVNSDYNPISIMDDIYNRNDRKSIRGNAALSWEILKGLTFRTEYGYSRSWSDTYWYQGPVAKVKVGLEGGDASISRNTSTRFRFANTLNYQVQGLGENHSLNVLLGQEINGTDGEKSKMEALAFPESFNFSKAFAMLNQGGRLSNTPFSNSFSEPTRIASFFGRINYSLKDRYLLTATLRADGSSKFSSDNQWGYFPAAAAAWRISGEPFMEGASGWLDNLKLRVSFGEAGNDRIDAGLWRSNWTAKSSGYSFNDVGSNYYVPTASVSGLMTNPDLKWETTITRNIGLDFGFFNNRLYGTIDGYWNTTEDLLLITDVPSYTGYTKQMSNYGETSNKGIEVSLGGDVVRNKDWRVSVNFNIGFNKNKIEDMGGETYKGYGTSWASNSTRPAEDYAFYLGDAVGLIRGYVTDGFYTTSDFKFDEAKQKYVLREGVPNSAGVVANTGLPDPYPGMLRFKKLSSKNDPDNINEKDDVTVIGNTNPKHTGGLNINATWKNFDLMLAFNWSYGNDIYNANKLANATMIKQNNINMVSEFANRYRIFEVNNSTGALERIPWERLDEANKNASIWYPYSSMGLVHTWGIEDGSFLRLNNVTLGYTLPQKLTKKISIQRLRVYATFYNAWLWTDYSGVDPEIDSGRGKNSTYPTPGMDWGTYPKARTYTFGVNISF